MKAGESEGERRAPQAQVECQNELHKFMGQGCHARSEPVLVLFFFATGERVCVPDHSLCRHFSIFARFYVWACGSAHVDLVSADLIMNPAQLVAATWADHSQPNRQHGCRPWQAMDGLARSLFSVTAKS